MVYTTNSHEQLELFSEADMENVQIESSELEELESLLVEDLESIPVDRVAKDVNPYMGDNLGNGQSSYVIRQLTKVFTSLIKKSVKKIMMNPRTRSKLEAACRKGPRAVAKLITPNVSKPLPSYLRFLAPIFVSPIVAKLFPSICKETGLKSEEIEGFWLPALGGAIAAKLGIF